MTGNGNWMKRQWEASMLRRAMLVAPPVVLLVLVGFWKVGNGKNVEYYTAKVEQGNISQVVQATGTINAVTTVQVGSQVSGNIQQLNVDFNSKVKKGDIIAQLDPAIFRARLQQSEADLLNAQANVKNIEASIDTQKADNLSARASLDRARAQAREAELNFKRTQELVNEGIFSSSQLETAQANRDSLAAGVKIAEAAVTQGDARLKSAQAQLEQVRAQVAQRRAAAELSRVDLGNTTIRAPIDGTVIARNVDVGQTVAASLQAPTLFLLAQDLTKMLVYAKTDEADVGKIRVGAVTSFRVDSFPREMFRGRVSQVRMNATTIQNVVTYDTIIEFDNPDQKLFPGMTAYVSIPVAWANDVVKVPNGALRFTPDMTDDEKKAIYAKYNIPEERRPGKAGGAGQGSTAGGSQGQGGQPQGGQPQGGQQAAATPQAPSGAAAPGTPGGGAGAQQNAAPGAPGQGGTGGQRGGGQGPGGFGGGGQAGEGGQRRMMMGFGGSGGPRDEWKVVWKIDAKKNLIPVRVRLGVTDFTFTEMKEGTLKAGEELVIGESTGKSRAQTTNQTNRPPGLGGQSPMGPGGQPRRF